MTNNTIGAPVVLKLKTNGQPLPDNLGIVSVGIEKRVNEIPVARIVVQDGDSGTFSASSSPLFVPGTALSIEAGYGSDTTSLFTGIITGLKISADSSQGPFLEVECLDPAFRMRAGKKSRSYSMQTVAEVISTIVSSYSGLSALTSATDLQNPLQVQYDLSDWDYVLSLAEMNGMIITLSDGILKLAPPDASAAPVLNLTYGENLLEFKADLKAVSQLGAATASAWDFKTQSIISERTRAELAGAGDLPTKELSEILGLSGHELRTSASLAPAELSNWSKAQIIKMEYSKIRGQAKFQGNARVEPGSYIAFSGLGTRFDGNYFISGLEHTISEGNWLTEVSLGLSEQWLSEQPGALAPSATGIIPGIKGLLNGKVRQLAGDPDAQYRILVDVPILDPQGAGIWARLANFYSGSGAGAFFLPEIGDEVILGFINEDPRYPVILGSLYSAQCAPAEGLSPKDDNPLKAFVSRSGISMQFDDENKVLTLQTPGKNTIIVSDKDKRISIHDENANLVVMSGEGISLTSAKDISISSGRKLILKGDQGVEIGAAGGDVDVKGMNIKETADMQYSAQGGQTAQVSGGMQLTLKGAMVMIN
ncbi:type VI secretion system tip protein VgrG [Pedobacter sp. SYSU D00535]|uniref:type VI secretion system tip protein VgrG n=1 Tax=Pedobacter sp. SYSU D00535 TaxID=2810308 RepID=UPI001A9750CD|nr:type VI secretion system tip protein VgrG [Pedobacter sp. SYSU D00535]